MSFVPLRDTVLCRKIVSEKEKSVESGIAYEKENLPLYEVIQVGREVSSVKLSAGDVIVTNSIPTPLSKDDKLYLISEKYIAAIVH